MDVANAESKHTPTPWDETHSVPAGDRQALLLSFSDTKDTAIFRRHRHRFWKKPKSKNFGLSKESGKGNFLLSHALSLLWKHGEVWVKESGETENSVKAHWYAIRSKENLGNARIVWTSDAHILHTFII